MKHVALLTSAPMAYGSGIALGVAEYACAHARWTFAGTPRGVVSPTGGWEVFKWKGDGVIAEAPPNRPEVYRLLRELGVPVVLVGESEWEPTLPTVIADSPEAGRMAARHLVGNGARALAFVHLPEYPWSVRRYHGFVEEAQRVGIEPLVFHLELPVTFPSHEHDDAVSAKAARLQKQLSKWIMSLPKPIGLMACNDVVGALVTTACHSAGITVPYEMTVIGVDNDPLYCRFSNPQLSSVELPVASIGFQAAALLDRLMHKKKPQKLLTLLPPTRVVSRRSSDILAFEDKNVARAVQFIRSHASSRIEIDAIAKHAFVSRRTLDRRFADVLGHSVKEEINRARLDLARRLLAQSDEPIEIVAIMSGFSDARDLNRVFLAAERLTPGMFRKKSRQRNKSRSSFQHSR